VSRADNDADLLIVGGGPAGLATAIRARECFDRVVLIDRGRPPIDKACGEGLMPDGLARLEALGVRLPREARMPFSGIRYLEGDLMAQGEFPGVVGHGIRRVRLQRAMVERAREVGVDLRWGTAARGLEASGVRTDRGLLGARFLVGADGLHSRVRLWAGLDGAPARRRRFGVRRHYRVEPWTGRVEVYWARGCEAYVTPVAPRCVGVAMLCSDRPARFDELLDRFPALRRRLDGGTIESEDRGAGPLEQRTRRVLRGNVALVGDAAGYLDAISGEGLSIAFHQAFALVRAMRDDDLAAYATEHRRIARVPNVMTRLLLLIERHPALRRRVFRALAGDPGLFSRLLAIHVRATRPADLGLRGILGLAGRLLFVPRRTLNRGRP